MDMVIHTILNDERLKRFAFRKMTDGWDYTRAVIYHPTEDEIKKVSLFQTPNLKVVFIRFYFINENQNGFVVWLDNNLNGLEIRTDDADLAVEKISEFFLGE